MSILGNSEGFKQSFLEEAREILVELEAALLQLNENPGDLELVGQVFRALHTIKGSGSMFGFDELATFTHNLETVFDEVRNGRLAITSDLIDLTLIALDQMKAMLAAGEGSAGADQAKCEEILVKVREMSHSGEGRRAEAEEGSAGVPPEATKGDRRDWNIHFAPGADMMRTGADPLLLLRELRQLGESSVRACMADIPPLAELDPERCYVSWDISLSTCAGLDAIRDVFIFVEDCCELEIEPAVKAATAEAVCAGDIVAKGLNEKRGERGGRREYDKPDSATSLRVPAVRLDQFVDLVGELVTVQARLSELTARSEDTEFAGVAEELERLTSALRETSMNIRMLPIRGTFERFRRLVHDLARDLGKNVEFTIEGADTELDKTVIEQLNDPLMHLIRNSMDHGIEAPEVRAGRGKPNAATIHLSARHSGASVLIGISDDGGGIDAEAVRNRAIERGLVSADLPLTEAEIFAFIFEAGFSTAKKVTDVSGRGVGMDVVRKHVEALRGSIDVASRRGLGTTVTLRLPLTLAIIDGLLVTVGEDYFVLPLANTLECIELTGEDVEKANGKHVADVRGEIIPYIRLRQQFNINTPRPEREQIMVVETEEGRYGFVVDQVLGNRQTVIKSLGHFYRHVQNVSGATILGDGTVALILDPQRLVQEAVRARPLGPRARAPGQMLENGRPRDGTPICPN